MKVFIVAIRTDLNYRFIDSLWVKEGNATKRIEDIRANLNRAGLPAWTVSYSSVTLQDAVLVEQPERDKTGKFKKK